MIKSLRIRMLMILSLIICLTPFGFAAEDPSETFKKIRIIPKVSLIYGEQLMGEVGLYRINYAFTKKKHFSRRQRSYSRLRPPGLFYQMHGIYSAIEFFDHRNETFFGPKIGYERSLISPTYGAAFGIEAKVYSNLDDDHNFVLAPKIGIPFGLMNLFYAYNWGTNDDFDSISGEHQFQLSFNLDFKIMKEVKAFLAK